MSVTLEEMNEKLDRIGELALISAKTVLDLNEAALFTGFSIGHLYRLTSGRQIPHFKKNRKLYFKKSDLEAWMCDNRVQTVYTNLKVYHFLIKKCTTPNRLQRYA